MIFNMDMINGLFEFAGALLLTLNVRRLARDKRITGVHWGPTLFFAAWGVWNLFYYPSLDQRWSFYGGCCLVAVNCIWLVQVWYFSAKAEDAQARAWWDERVAAEQARFDEEIRINDLSLRNWYGTHG